jgi:hypothetical protein
MDQISDLKQWLDSQRVKSEKALSPHHNGEEDFMPESLANEPFVPSPKFKQERYLWHEDGKDEHPEMNLNRVAEKEPMTDYEKAKALWYKNAWESVQPVNTEMDSSNTFKKAHRKLAIARTCPQCYSSDDLYEENRVTVFGHLSVDNEDVQWYDSETADDYEFVAINCYQCNWRTTNPNWLQELGYDNRKNSAKTAALISVDWDDDGEAVPSLVEVPFEVLQTELDGGGQVADWLSDNYGWTVNGWDFVDHPDDIGEDQSPLWHEG